MSVNRKNILWCVIAASFLWSLLYSFYYRIPPVVDAQAYDQIAINLMEGFGFREDRTKSFEFDRAIVRAGPGYEFFLAGVYTLFGHRYEAVWIVQAMLHALSTLLLFFICRKIFLEKGDVIGLIAAVLFGLHPDLIEVSAMLMTETLYLFLIILLLYVFVLVYEQSDNTIFSVVFGVSTGLAVLTRPPVILFIPVTLYMYYRLKRYRPAVWFGVGLLLLILPWAVRNYLVYHQFIVTTLIGEYNLWAGNTPLANGGQISSDFYPLTTFASIHGFVGLRAKASSEFWSFLIAYPFIFIKLCFIRFVRYFSLIRPMGFWFYQTGRQQLIFIISSATALALSFWSGFTGMLLALKEKKPLFYYFVIFALASPLALIPTVVESRYRFQIYPFLAIFGGYAFIELRRAKRSRSGKSFIFVGAILFSISLIDMLLSWSVVIERMRLLI